MINELHDKISNVHETIITFHEMFKEKNLNEIPVGDYLEFQKLLHSIQEDITTLEFAFNKIENIANTSFNFLKQEYNLLVVNNIMKVNDDTNTEKNMAVDSVDV